MKKLITVGVTMLAALSLTACASGSSSKKSGSNEKASSVNSSSAAKSSSKKASSSSKKAANGASIPTTADKEWFVKDNVFYAGNETMTFTKSEVRDGLDSGTKVLVIYTTIRNNSGKEQDPSNFYMVLHAKQKNDTSNVSLDPGMLGLDDNGNSPLQTYEDNLNNSLLPGKTVTAVLEYELKNTNPVTLEISNDSFDTIGTKTYQVQ
ncbi:DUF5067 domain-containing protein [Lacticaseibacillus sp. 866-1]|uniref:DUF5067 domain-containing protein n=1 Tax=Lacticaseibacillus sp. 866-1 TaxID=2799576 RepID=UPI001944A9DF|nr:DUF5067 domain-containing protein [Lacticaseibacillus sp. 866-1]